MHELRSAGFRQKNLRTVSREILPNLPYGQIVSLSKKRPLRKDTTCRGCIIKHHVLSMCNERELLFFRCSTESANSTYNEMREVSMVLE